MPDQHLPQGNALPDGTSGGHAVSVVVVALAGGDALDRCLAAIVPQCDAVHGELIVAAQTDVLCGRAERVRQVVAPASTWSHVRAAAVAAARGNVIVMTEDHCTPAPHWLEHLLAAHASGVEVAGGPIRPSHGTPWMWAVYLQEYGGFARTPPEPGRFSDCNVSYRRAVLESCRDTWWPSYHQPQVDKATVAFGHRGGWVSAAFVTEARHLTLPAALRERVRLGREYGTSQASKTSLLKAAARLPLAPFGMTARALATTVRHGLGIGRTLGALPFIVLLALGWVWGEFRGTIDGASP